MIQKQRTKSAPTKTNSRDEQNSPQSAAHSKGRGKRTASVKDLSEEAHRNAKTVTPVKKRKLTVQELKKRKRKEWVEAKSVDGQYKMAKAKEGSNDVIQKMSDTQNDIIDLSAAVERGRNEGSVTQKNGNGETKERGHTTVNKESDTQEETGEKKSCTPDAIVPEEKSTESRPSRPDQQGKATELEEVQKPAGEEKEKEKKMEANSEGHTRFEAVGRGGNEGSMTDEHGNAGEKENAHTAVNKESGTQDETGENNFFTPDVSVAEAEILEDRPSRPDQKGNAIEQGEGPKRTGEEKEEEKEKETNSEGDTKFEAVGRGGHEGSVTDKNGYRGEKEKGHNSSVNKESNETEQKKLCTPEASVPEEKNTENRPSRSDQQIATEQEEGKIPAGEEKEKETNSEGDTKFEAVGSGGNEGSVTDKHGYRGEKEKGHTAVNKESGTQEVTGEKKSFTPDASVAEETNTEKEKGHNSSENRKSGAQDETGEKKSYTPNASVVEEKKTDNRPSRSDQPRATEQEERQKPAGEEREEEKKAENNTEESNKVNAVGKGGNEGSVTDEHRNAGKKEKGHTAVNKESDTQ